MERLQPQPQSLTVHLKARVRAREWGKPDLTIHRPEALYLAAQCPVRSCLVNDGR